MSDQDLATRLEAVNSDADFSDPNLYAKLLGYDQEGAAVPAPAAEQTTTQGETAAPAPATEAAPAAPDSTQPPASAETTAEPEIAGALTKDGKHVIPYSVVQDLRTTTTKQAERIAELQAAMERMQAERQAQAEGTSTAATQAQADAAAVQFSEDELADLEAIPAAAKLVKGFQALQQQLATMQSAPPQHAQTQPAPNVEAVQSAIDANPLLVKWQAKGGELWQRAVEMDAQLQRDPQWAGKPMAERFAQVQKLVADDYGIPVQSAPSAPPAAAQQPRPAASPAVRETMPTLSDFAGGPMAVGDPMAGMSAAQMTDKAMSMSVEDLRKMVGLSY